ncbi:MAG: AbiU2 domain-containing protein, partial [Chloroflexota bacterium]
LHIARLTDPPKQGQFDNLSLLRLPEEIEDSALEQEVRYLVGVARDRSQFAREWRNKHIAHRDLRLALDAEAEPLPGVSRQQVEEALASIAVVMNVVHAHFLGAEVAFRHFVAHGDGDALVYWLQSALRSERLQQKRWHEGRWLPEDFEALPET